MVVNFGTRITKKISIDTHYPNNCTNVHGCKKDNFGSKNGATKGVNRVYPEGVLHGTIEPNEITIDTFVFKYDILIL